MCTAISFNAASHYFGRNLDLEYAYDEAVVITPRRFPLSFSRAPMAKRHLAMIGVAAVMNGYPLYYDATNETGLSAAGLNFPDNAFYPDAPAAKNVIAPFEFIPWLLSRCSCVAQARRLLADTRLAAIAFCDTLPIAPLHFLISDAKESIVVEPMKEGLCIYDNPVGILTNNPPFPYHMTHLSSFMALGSSPPENRFAPTLPLHAFSRGMGALGLPGDLSSPSRFVRAAFMKAHALCKPDAVDGVTQFFHILSSVRHIRGSVLTGDGRPVITLYSSCCDTQKGIYYYTTYENSQITAVDMRKEDLDGARLIIRPLIREQQIRTQNK